MALVLDASVALAWCFPDEGTAYSQGVLAAVVESEALVPAIWPLEIANGLLIGERRQRLGPSEVMRSVELLEALPIRVNCGEVSRSLRAIRVLARERGLSAYDASYLDLAFGLGLSLASIDGRLRDAATRVGVPLVQ